MVRKNPDDLKMLNRLELLKLIQNIDDPRDKALACFIYLTGGRASEAVGIKVEQLKKEDRHGKEFLTVYNMRVLKRRGKKEYFRTVPINVEKEIEFVRPILAWLQANTSEYLFPSIRGNHINRKQAWHILDKKLGLFTHFMRHLRCTHLVQYYNFNGYELQQFIGWRKVESSDPYVKLAAEDVIKKMV